VFVVNDNRSRSAEDIRLSNIIRRAKIRIKKDPGALPEANQRSVT
jgi:hypothetical protein